MIEAVPYFDLKIIKNVDKNGSTGHYAKSNCHIILQAGTSCGTFVQRKIRTKIFRPIPFRDKNVVNLAFCDKNVTI